MERDGEKECSTEENDQLSRSTKKMKRVGASSNGTEVVDDMEVTSSGSPMCTRVEQPAGVGRSVSYRDTLQRNNPNLHFETRNNPM